MTEDPGSPGEKMMRAALLAELAREVPDSAGTMTPNAQLIARSLVKWARNGDTTAAKEILQPHRRPHAVGPGRGRAAAPDGAAVARRRRRGGFIRWSRRMTSDGQATPTGVVPAPGSGLGPARGQAPAETHYYVTLDDGSPRSRGPQSCDPEEPEPEPDRLLPLALHELLALPLPPRGMVLDPIIPERGLALIYATRGIGKTHLALGIAYAVATGGRFLKWRAPRPRRVLLVDGETPAATLRERLAGIAAEGGAAPAELEVLAGDLVPGGIGNLAAPEVQTELEYALCGDDPAGGDRGVDLLVLDHLSSITRALHDDAVGWAPIGEWLLRLRRGGTSVLIVDHAGRRGDPRGSSRREDTLDTSIRLVRPRDHAAADGARFEVHVEKGRALAGEQAKPFEARLALDAGRPVWSVRELIDVQGHRVAALANAGLSVRDIAAETGLSKSAVHRLKRKMEKWAMEGVAEG